MYVEIEKQKGFRIRVDLRNLIAFKTKMEDEFGQEARTRWMPCKLTKRMLTEAFAKIMKEFLQKEERYSGKVDRRFKEHKKS